jgi:HD-like signal output (HDOD) protein
MGRNLIEETLRRELVQTFQDPEYRPPPLPAVVIRLSQMARSEETSVNEVVRLLEQDPMLAGVILRLVASPLYATRSPITTLHQAVVNLGLKTLHNVVFEAVVRRGVFHAPEYRETLERIGRHGTVGAYIAKLLCEACGVEGDRAFLCGLLHDIGFSALIVSTAVRTKGASRKLEALWSDFDGMHERASNLVARLWSLPPETSDVLGHHHHPERCGDSATARIAAAVCIADALTESFDAHIIGPKNQDGTFPVTDCVIEESLSGARTLLGLDDEKLAGVIEKAERLVPGILSG